MAPIELKKVIIQKHLKIGASHVFNHNARKMANNKVFRPLSVFKFTIKLLKWHIHQMSLGLASFS